MFCQIGVGLPTGFAWDNSTTSGPVIKLIVSFDDNKPDDVAELTREPVTFISVEEEEEENECVLTGHLRDESNATVAINGCPGSDNYEVSYDFLFFTKVKKLIFKSEDNNFR